MGFTEDLRPHPRSARDLTATEASNWALYEVDADVEAYMHRVSTTPRLSAEVEQELLWAVARENSGAAREHVVRANLGLVADIARNYTDRGLTLRELIGEGNLGLLRAVETYDPAPGARFSTFASWWIKQAIRRAVLGSGIRPESHSAHPINRPSTRASA